MTDDGKKLGFPDPKFSQPDRKKPKPLTPIRGSSFAPTPKPPPTIPKPKKPTNVSREPVRREVRRRYQSFLAFKKEVERYAREEFRDLRSGEPPYFREIHGLEGTEILLDVFGRIKTEFRDLDEVHWFLTSNWKGAFDELHVYLIARAIRRFILERCEKEKDGKKVDSEAKYPHFPSPTGLRWEEVTLTFIKQTIRVRARTLTRDYPLGKLGLANRKTNNPNQLCLALAALAGNSGEADWDDLAPSGRPRNRNTVEANVKRLRHLLKSFFGLQSNPIQCQQGRYITVFKISQEYQFQKQSSTKSGLEEVYEESTNPRHIRSSR